MLSINESELSYEKILSEILLKENDMIMRKRKKKVETKKKVYENESKGMILYTDNEGKKYESENLMKYKMNS